MRRGSKWLLLATPLLLIPTLSRAPARFVELQGGSVSFFYPPEGIRAEFHVQIENVGGSAGTPRCWVYLPNGRRRDLRLTEGVPIPAGETRWIEGVVSLPRRLRSSGTLDEVAEECA